MNITRFFTLLLALLVLTVGCAPSSSDQEADTTAQEEPMEDPSDQMEEMNDSFKVTTLNDSIPSPRRELTANIAGADIVINYGSPSVKGRSIWGELVPYDVVCALAPMRPPPSA